MLRHCHLFALLLCILFCGCLGLPYDVTSTHAVRRLYYQKRGKFNKVNNLGKFSLKIAKSAFLAGIRIWILDCYRSIL
jgi:hypothetical protein